MFKIKVGLKSFQKHSMQKCEHQIGRIVSYLKQTSTSFPASREKRGHNLAASQPRKSGPTLRGKRHLELAPVRRELLTGDGEQLQPSTNKMEPTPYKQKSCRTNVRKPKGQDQKGVDVSQNDPLVCSANQRSAKNIRTNDLQESRRLKGRADFLFQKRVESPLRITPLPTFVKKITTLRSPHIDKKSREQFEWRREKTQIGFDLDSVPQMSFVLFILTHSRFPGVEIEIGVESKTYFG